MSQTFLRRGVRVSENDQAVSIDNSMWSIDIPREWVERAPGFRELLRRERPVESLSRETEGLAGIIEVLRSQGCFSFPDDRPSYTLREVREVFNAVAARWYRDYYAHPLWDALRSGSISRSGLAAWAIHNYHLSRSAGMTDARCAVRFPNQALRGAFLRSTLDEYSHCDDFYFVRHQNLNVSDDEVKSYVHVPNSLAFDQHMFRTAEDDWLGHVLVSYFQESSAAFYAQCREFFRSVEGRYEIPGFFRSWEEHIRLDLKERHANHFYAMMESDEPLGAREVHRALRDAWFTYVYLLHALDDVLREAETGSDGEIRLRSPIRDGRLAPDTNSLLHRYRSRLGGEARVGGATALELYERLAALGVAGPPPGRESGRRMAAADDSTYLGRDLVLTIYKAMSYCSRHEEVMLFGRLAERGADLLAADGTAVLRPDSPEAMAVANFLWEAATRPEQLPLLLYQVAASTQLLQAGQRELLRDHLHADRISSELADRATTSLLQLNELLDDWIERPTSGGVDFFRD
jgi:hypothetical protein